LFGRLEMPDPTRRQLVALLLIILGVLAFFLLVGLVTLAEQGKCC
jgi:hypothetical protein